MSVSVRPRYPSVRTPVTQYQTQVPVMSMNVRPRFTPCQSVPDEILFRTNELIFRTNEIIFRTSEILFRTNEILFRTNEIIFHTNEILFRHNKMLFRTNEKIFRTNEIIFHTNEILFLRNKIIFRTNEIFFRTNKTSFCTDKILFRTNEIKNHHTTFWSITATAQDRSIESSSMRTHRRKTELCMYSNVNIRGSYGTDPMLGQRRRRLHENFCYIWQSQ